ncbi:hypothetical protein [Polyangium jinanense]|uniref:Ribbon-helix-helix protein CopG domain-containing protein n=1 Tax=Polyangium jinanense TaxID=2829994 RepID=A0A9X3X3F0_9BACT|nr:hypothetical protein [Polyangium jinanense]MDC3955182.1 hypothetical protein [Polyangium jinanense]MDC3981483.1 hypothetical protein [Polyangium jinanense]
MARMASKDEKVRLNLEVPKRVRERLERVQEMSEADSLTEVIRRALTLYDALLTTAREDKGKLLVRYEDGSERELMLV